MKNTNSTTLKDAMKAFKNQSAAAETAEVNEVVAMIEQSFMPGGKLDEILQVEQNWTAAIEEQNVAYKKAVRAKEEAFKQHNDANTVLKEMQAELEGFKREWLILAGALSNREQELHGLIEEAIKKSMETDRYGQMLRVAEATGGEKELERVTREMVTLAVGNRRVDLLVAIRELKTTAEQARVRWVEAEAALNSPEFIPAAQTNVDLFKVLLEEKKAFAVSMREKLNKTIQEAEAAKAEALK